LSGSTDTLFYNYTFPYLLTINVLHSVHRSLKSSVKILIKSPEKAKRKQYKQQLFFFTHCF